MRIASVVMKCSQDPAANLAAVTDSVCRITSFCPDTKLIVFGEMITGWYRPLEEPEYHRQISLHLNDPVFSGLLRTARERRVHICFGMSELFEGQMYNSQVLAGSDGSIQAVHRKRNLKKGEVLAGYMPGDEPVTFTEINGLRTAVVICSDAADFATVKKLMRSRFDLLILSLADDRDEKWFMARCNARMYDSWIVTSNRYGYESERFWGGHAVISDPHGKIRERSVGKEAVLMHDVQPFGGSSFIRKQLVRLPVPFIILGNIKSLRSYF